MLLVVYNLNGSSRMLMMRISDYNNDKVYANNTLLRTNDKKINKAHINNTEAIVKISIKPDDRGKLTNDAMVASVFKRFLWI